MKLFMIEGDVLEKMVGACVSAFPNEACGFLAGSDRRATAHYPVTNIADDPSQAFYMEPEGQLRAHRLMDDRGEELVAIYHSHPKTSAFPSRADIRQALYPQVYYVIVGFLGGRPDVRAFRLNPERERAVEIRWQRIGHSFYRNTCRKQH